MVTAEDPTTRTLEITPQASVSKTHRLIVG